MADDPGGVPCDTGSTSTRTGLRKRTVSSTVTVATTKQKLTSAEHSKAYRERIKQNPGLYKAYRAYENIRVKTYVATISEEKREQYSEKTKERVRKYRARQRERGELPLPKARITTRSEKENQRAKWRLQKTKQLSNETDIQRANRNANRRKAYAEKNKPKEKQAPPMVRSKTSTDLDPLDNESASTPATVPPTYRNEESLRKAVYRASQSMPQQKRQFADVLVRMVSKSTPKTKHYLHERLIGSPRSKKKLNFVNTSVANLRETLDGLKKKRNKADLGIRRTLAYSVGRKIKSKYIVQHSRKLGIGYKLMKQVGRASSQSDMASRKRRKDAIVNSIKEKIHMFYRRCDISRSLPDARSAKKSKNGDLVGRMVMERSLVSAHDQFLSEHPEMKISRSQFAKLRPADVMPSTSNRRRDCLCEYCTNVELKLEGIKVFAASHRLVNVTYKDKHDLSRSTLCRKGTATGEYQRKCLERSCPDCGTNTISTKLQPFLEMSADATLSYYKWENVIFAIGDVSKKRMTRLKKTKPVAEFVAELIEESRLFSKHLFDASWQGRQYDFVSRDVPDGCVVVCQDFAENFKCHFQDEAQGAHWGYTQVTLHASVASYRCTDQNCTEVTSEAIIFVSDDNKHDYHAVHHFNGIMMEHLKEQQAIPVQKVVYFSDGAPGQYKNKSAFADLSCAEEDFGIEAERHFFGTRHGKGPCDREFGTLKKAVGLQILGRKAEIDSAEDFFQFCKKTYTRPQQPEHVHYRRTFFYVAKEDVQRERNRAELKTLNKTRQQHCLRMVKPFVVSYRERSCFCDVCIGKITTEDCRNTDVTGTWNTVHLQKGQRHKEQHNRTAAHHLLPPVEDAVEDGPPTHLEDGPPTHLEDGPPAHPEDGSPTSQDEEAERKIHLADYLPKLPYLTPVKIDDELSSSDSEDIPYPIGSTRHSLDVEVDPLLQDAEVDSRDPPSKGPTTQASPDTTRIKYGSWVVVEFRVAKHDNAKFFHAMVLQYDHVGGEAKVKFLRLRGSFYSFPEVDDVAWVRKEDITLQDPPTINSRGQHFF